MAARRCLPFFLGVILLRRAVPLARGRKTAACPRKRKKRPMNNSDIADLLASETGSTKADARKAVDLIFSTIADAAAKGEEVSLNGFGKFKVKDVSAREGRNPATGAAMTIAASRKLSFTVAKAVKDKLNG